MLLTSFFCLSAYSQTGSNDSNTFIAQLKHFSSVHIPEKVYLHFDKPYYAAGDTIYFKAYITMGERHLLSALSAILHVDLISSQNKVLQSIKLKIDSGVAWGDFALSDSLPKGNYRIRAYTRWMSNEDDDAFFEHIIAVGSLDKNQKSESITQSTQSPNFGYDFQFFPEGGNLVSGIESKVAFKAIAANQDGVTVKGEILDNENKLVTNFTSIHLGMGCFYFTPQESKIYKAKITYADGFSEERDLPKAMESGIILSIDNDSIPKASIKIISNKSYFEENKNKRYNLLIWSGGKATTIPCTLDSQVINLDILKRRLKTGVVRVTLFSPTGEPLSERLLFIQNYDQLNINLMKSKNTYSKRENVSIKLHIKTRADSASIGHFSISVIDETKMPSDENSENTILTNLLLTSELKGFVEQPNYYFKNLTDAKTQNELDLVMLTHGYRRFEWKKLLNDAYTPPTCKPETSLEITGVAKNTFGKPLINATVSLISLNGGSFMSETTDNSGGFYFTNLSFTDSAKFILQAVNAKGKNVVKLDYNQEKPVAVREIKSFQTNNMNTVMPIYIKNLENQLIEANVNSSLKGKVLKEVKIIARKPVQDKSSRIIPLESANQVIYGKDIRYGGSLAVRLMSLVHGIHFVSGSNNTFIPVANFPCSDKPQMLVIVDGNRGSLEQVSTDAVDNIEILLPPISYAYGSDGSCGVIDITTKQGGQNQKDMVSVGILPITLMGFYKARDFYTPKYEHPNEDYKHPDLRSTIYWQPELMTDKDGNASFNFFNADGTGTYRVVIEGIDNKGNLGRQVYTYRVE
jgi:hypothetical protein